MPANGDNVILNEWGGLAEPACRTCTTPHFDGHPSVLVRASRLAGVRRDELVELVQDAWLSQASRRRAEAWLAERGLG